MNDKAWLVDNSLVKTFLVFAILIRNYINIIEVYFWNEVETIVFIMSGGEMGLKKVKGERGRKKERIEAD